MRCASSHRMCNLEERGYVSIRNTYVEKSGVYVPLSWITSQRSKRGAEMVSRELAVQMNNTWLRSIGTLI